MAKLNAILKQMQEMGKSSDRGSINTSGTFVTSGGQAAVITGINLKHHIYSFRLFYKNDKHEIIISYFTKNVKMLTIFFNRL
jgi:hypothetical protein